MFNITQFYIKVVRPIFYAYLTRFLYSGNRVKIGMKFRADSIPRIIVDKNCKLTIENNVYFRRNVEIRSHGQSKIHIGNQVQIDRGVRLLAANNSRISIGDGSSIGLYSVLNGGDSITIGKKCLISGYVYLQTSLHGFRNKKINIKDQGYTHAPVILEDDTWLGAHVVILPGIILDKGAVVGSNAVVTKNIKSYQVVAGIPAELIKERE